MRRLGIVVIWLNLLGVALAQEPSVIIAWEFPRAIVIDSFLVTYRRSTDSGGVLQQFRVPWTADPTCAVLGDQATPDTVCARPPECWSPGIYTLSVQAERGKAQSPPSNWASCEALPGCRVDCAKFQDANTTLLDPPPPPQDPPPPPDGPPPPGQPSPLTASGEALKSQLDALVALIPKAPPQPVVATAPT